jgi:predicted ferric reductase
MVVLIARIPWIEGAVGQDRLVRWHRRLAPWGLGLITAHVVLVTLGYAQSARSGALAQLWTFVTTYPDMLAAIAGFSLLLLAGATSIRIARQRMRYETWWIVHLYTYLALALSFTHQIATGRTFVGHPLARALWLSVWVSVAGAVLAFRVLLPLARSLRHRLRVVAVTEETPGVFVVVCRGRRLDRLAVSGGQFFRWRFLNRDLWWHAHPYSLSALPKPPFLRLTVKSSGDQSAAVASITPGTAVMIEGPYGTFTRHAGSRDRVALIAAGVGVTPLRALLEDLPRSVDVVVVLRATRREDLVHRDEMAALVARRGGKLYEVVGPRNTVPLTDKTLGQLIPDLAHRDVYVCGPDGFADVIVDASRRLGVPRRSIHREAFGF